MSPFNSRLVGRGVKKAVTAFFSVATVISFSSATVRADEVSASSSQASRSQGIARFLPIAGPVFGLPVFLQNLTWGNFQETENEGSGSVTTSNLTWGNFQETENEESSSVTSSNLTWGNYSSEPSGAEGTGGTN